MNEDNIYIRQDLLSPDEADTSDSSRNISHLFGYYTQTDPQDSVEPDCLLDRFGITAKELEYILEKK